LHQTVGLCLGTYLRQQSKKQNGKNGFCQNQPADAGWEK
jgi:hypothetical protein